MFEKVNCQHPDKIADRIAGAIVDLAYSKQENPKVAVEVLIGHNLCTIINETSCHIETDEVLKIVKRISESDDIELRYLEVPQDEHLAKNQEELRCGDNGVFKGVPTNAEEKELTRLVQDLYSKCKYDGKYIINGDEIIACQSHMKENPMPEKITTFNPLGYWTGGINVDSGATNRKLGSDMGRAVTGSGIHAKDLSKADVSVNIYCHLLAEELQEEVEAYCSIGAKTVSIYCKGIEWWWLKTYEEIVNEAKIYIESLGGFEKFAEWGLIR